MEQGEQGEQGAGGGQSRENRAQGEDGARGGGRTGRRGRTELKAFSWVCITVTWELYFFTDTRHKHEMVRGCVHS